MHAACAACMIFQFFVGGFAARLKSCPDTKRVQGGVFHRAPGVVRFGVRPGPEGRVYSAVIQGVETPCSLRGLKTRPAEA